jgi:protease I
MSNELQGKKIAFLVANSGVEQVELTTPWQSVVDAGGEPVLVAPEAGKAQAFNNDVEQADQFDVDVTVDDADPADYAALVLPGGTTNPDKLRTIPSAVAFASAFVDARKPVAAICHGPWTLVEAGVLGGKTLTSWPSLHTDIVNAGAHEWVDQEVFVCPDGGWTLVTSRNPDDLPAFTKAVVEEFAKA